MNDGKVHLSSGKRLSLLACHFWLSYQWILVNMEKRNFFFVGSFFLIIEFKTDETVFLVMFFLFFYSQLVVVFYFLFCFFNWMKRWYKIHCWTTKLRRKEEYTKKQKLEVLQKNFPRNTNNGTFVLCKYSYDWPLWFSSWLFPYILHIHCINSRCFFFQLIFYSMQRDIKWAIVKRLMTQNDNHQHEY